MNKKWTLLLLAPNAIVCPAYSQDYLSIEQAQKIFYPQATHFKELEVKLSAEQREKIEELFGVRQRTNEQKVWKAFKGDKFLGWVVLDNVIGKHEYITYATALSGEGHVVGVEILSYRETHGGQVRQTAWRNRFKNKTLSDPFKLDVDVPNISGATLSCRNITNGVKRLLALQKIALHND